MTPAGVAARTDRVWHRALGWRPASRLPGDVADLVGEVRRAVAEGRTRVPAQAEALEVDSDRRYDESLPDDSALEAALRRRVADSPEAFG